MLVAGNKCDLASDEQVAKFEAYVKEKGYSFFPIMAAIHYGVDPLIKKITEELSKLLPSLPTSRNLRPRKSLKRAAVPSPSAIRMGFGLWRANGC